MTFSTELLIAIGFGLFFAVVARLVRRRFFPPKRGPRHFHEVLMERAEVHAGQSPFLRKICSDNKKNGHLSERQVAGIEKALARIDGAR